MKTLIRMLRANETKSEIPAPTQQFLVDEHPAFKSRRRIPQRPTPGPGVAITEASIGDTPNVA